jgi:HK97 family phage portal protein
LGLIDFINKFKKIKQNFQYAQMLNGYTPIFSQFGQDIYASDVVQQAISCLVTELTKANPYHIKKDGSDLVPVENSEIQRLLEEPNERMTQTDFFEKVYWQLFLNYNAFIVPTYYRDNKGNKKYTGLYPIQPIDVTFLQDPEGKLGIQFKFINGYETILAYSDVIHIKYRYSVNEFMGGNEKGQPDNKALLKTLELNHTLLQGVAKALKSSFSINGVIKYNTLMDDGKMEENIKNMEKRLANNESGFLPLDIKGEYIPLQNKIQLVDATTLKFIDEKILRNFGVSLPILTGDYTKAQYEAFYQKSLEPILKRTGESFTMSMFSVREKGFGNKIMMYPHELIFMDTSQKIELFDLLVDSASCYKNELRTAFGMRPLPELAGEIAMSSNKANAENNKVENEDNSSIGGSENEE